jgi:hypothetical protein
LHSKTHNNNNLKVSPMQVEREGEMRAVEAGDAGDEEGEVCMMCV